MLILGFMGSPVLDQLPQVFHPIKALPAGDPRYVDCSEARGSRGVLKSMANQVRRAGRQSCQLFSGLRGCGKTTELNHLAQDLGDGSNGKSYYFVVSCDTDESVDMSDVEYTDVLLALVSRTWSELKRTGIDLEPGKLKSFVDEVKDLLASEVVPKSLTLGESLAKISFEIKQNPNNRSLVRQQLQPRTTPFLEAVNEVVDRALIKLAERGYSGLVVIADNLDRIIPGSVLNSNRSKYDALFIDNAANLGGLNCHVIYTVPPGLVYSRSGPNLTILYGGAPVVLPMVPTTSRDGSPDPAGVAKMREILEKRAAYAGTTIRHLFDSGETVERICAASGGYDRHLISIVQTAGTYLDDLPITREAVETAISQIRDVFVYSVGAREPWDMLREVAASKELGRIREHLGLLENSCVLAYRNGSGPWYDVHPIAKETREFLA